MVQGCPPCAALQEDDGVLSMLDSPFHEELRTSPFLPTSNQPSTLLEDRRATVADATAGRLGDAYAAANMSCLLALVAEVDLLTQ
jgi:hypothetical protein